MSQTAQRQIRRSEPQRSPARRGAARPASAGEHHPLLSQQAAFGNQAVQQLLKSGVIQPKMTVNPPHDRFEQEADRVADHVMRMPESSLQRQTEEDEESVQTMPLAGDISALQRETGEDGEEVQTRLQRQEEEEETVQTSLSSHGSGHLQRQAEDEEQEETPLQAMVESGMALRELQRQEEDEEEGAVQAERAASNVPDVSPALETQINASRGGGNPLDGQAQSFFEPRFGHDFSGVRIHNDAEAGQVARALNAQAFTRGQDVFFAPGRYQPDSQDGRRLLAHELTHTVQQGGGSSAAPATTSDGQISRKRRRAASESQTRHGVHGKPASPTTASQAGAGGHVPLARQAEGGGGEGGGAPAEVVSLDGAATFTPPAGIADYLEQQGGRGGDVRVRLGAVAAGTIRIKRLRSGKYSTVGEGYQKLSLTHPALQPLQGGGIEPALAIRVRNDTISGFASVARGDRVLPNPTALTDAIRQHADLLGWVGMDRIRFPSVENSIEGGSLRLQVSEFNFRLGGFINGTGSFGLLNTAVTFNATATVSVRGLTDTELAISRDSEGKLSGSVNVPVSFADFSGNVKAEFANGTVDIEGTAGYETEKLGGEVTLIVTDEASARNVALQQLNPNQIAAGAQEAAAPGGAEGPVPGPRAVAGWGTLNFRFNEWLTGRATVIVDSTGNITAQGEITPPAEVELFPQRDFIRELFTLEVRTLYGVPLVGNVFLFANIGLAAMAKFGPGKIYNIRVAGTYSTDPRIFNRFSIEATLNISAFAGLRLRGEGGAGVELLGHDIKAGVGVNALAGVRGYVEATPTFGYRETDAAQQGEFFLTGHLELAAQPFLGLSGDLFVELDSPWWSPAPDKTWTWPIGSLEYPLPGQFGIGADIDTKIPPDEVPEIQFGEVDFSADKFMTDLINDHVPTKSGADEQEQQGDWQEGTTTGESPEPTVVDTQGGAASQEPARGRQEAGDGEAPDPSNEQRWREGMRALGTLAEESQADPYYEHEIMPALARIKRQHGFNALTARQVGDDWEILARMNPEGTIKAQGKERPELLKNVETPKLDKLESEREPGVTERYLHDYLNNYKGEQKMLEYLEGRAARKLGRKSEKPALDAYNAKTGRSVTKNNKSVEFLKPGGDELEITSDRPTGTRIPDFFEQGKVVGDVKDVAEISKTPQMKDDARIARGTRVRLSGSDASLPPSKPFDLVVRAPVDEHPETRVSQPLRNSIKATGGKVYELIE